VLADLRGVFLDLDGEFAGGGQNHRARIFYPPLWQRIPGQQAVIEGDQKSGGLAGAGLGLPGDVAAGEGNGQGHGLNRRAEGKACVIEAALEGFVQAEVVEANVG